MEKTQCEIRKLREEIRQEIQKIRDEIRQEKDKRFYKEMDSFKIWVTIIWVLIMVMLAFGIYVSWAEFLAS